MMKYDAYEYQKQATTFLEEHPVAALFLDMGLGKTVITLTALLHLLEKKEIRKVLIIAPLRVAKYTWPQELEKWDHLKTLSYSVAIGSAKERVKAFEKEVDLYIINRENVKWMVQNIPFTFDAIVIDELSSFKNPDAKRFYYLNQVRSKAKRMIGLTGTPPSNGLTDLYGEISILDGGERFGNSLEKFCEKYFYLWWSKDGTYFSYRLRCGAKEEIYEKISDITMSMKAVDYVKMPDLIISETRVLLSPKEQEVYDKMCAQATADIDLNTVSASNSRGLITKLTQMANGAVYSDRNSIAVIHDRKLDALEDMIESMNGKPLLVVYWYKHDLYRIEERLSKIGVKYTQLDKGRGIEEWNKGNISVGLVHPMRVGHGLNLQEGGSTICWFSLTWSLELYQQMNARLYRQGQKENAVVVQHIIAADTIDEDIMNALQRKEKTQSGLIDAVKARLRAQPDKEGR